MGIQCADIAVYGDDNLHNLVPFYHRGFPIHAGYTSKVLLGSEGDLTKVRLGNGLGIVWITEVLSTPNDDQQASVPLHIAYSVRNQPLSLYSQ